MNARIGVVAGLAIAFGALACGPLSVDVSGGSMGKTGDEASKGLKQIKRFKDAYSAWQDAVENMSAEDEVALGDAASIELIKEAGGLDNSADVVAYVNSVGNLVGLQGERDPKAADKRPRIAARRFFFGVLRDDEHLNAFSTPGGHVFITSALLHRLNSESELAFVLGHEIAHIDAEDGLLAMKGKTGAPAALGSLSKDAYGQVNDFFDNKTIFDGAADKIVEIGLNKLKFLSREQETAADARGLSYAVKAGYDPKGAVSVLELLADAHADQPTADDHTHDPPEKRLVAIRSLADSAGGGDAGYLRFQQALVLAGSAP